MMTDAMIFTVMRSLAGAREETGLGRAGKAGIAKALSGPCLAGPSRAQAVRVAHGLLTQ